jgi:hypothetical protein
MQAYKFDTRISENGVISLPIEPKLFNKEVEVIILLKVAEKENSNKKILCPILLKNGRVHFRP